ncbi:MAG TPA: membrane dipeptidase [Candidatus Saccharimonadales bacterium]|nr:membrane dipeptidase [Candidatus Saccharimonadales bacterium]
MPSLRNAKNSPQRPANSQLHRGNDNNVVDRRRLLRSAAVTGVGLLAAPMINLGRFQLFAGTPSEYSSRAVELVARSTVIDMLSPFAISPTKTTQWFMHPETFTATDLEQFRSSGIRAFHIGIGIGGPEAKLETLQFFGMWNGFIAHHQDHLVRIDSPASLEALKKSSKIGVILGLQDSDHFVKVDDVDLYHGLGQRVSQLTYNSRNLIGNGSTERRDDGISDYGVAVIERMNRVGMAVDVSHSGDRTTLDAFELSKKPVLITHANCRALVPHPRCKTDEAIQKMAATGGVMGITGVRMFVKTEEPTTIEDALNHFDHVAKLVGVEHLGIGSDIDLWGYDKMPPKENEQLRAGYKGSYAFREKIDIEGLNHPKRMFDLTEGLIRRKYSDGDIELILGGNFKRALTQIWTI